jgi:hypothetical protein
MFERQISITDVRTVLLTGDIIKAYPDDTPYPSRLVLGWVENRPLHIVVADHPTAFEVIIITVYEPDPSLWDDDFRERRVQ